MNIIIFFIETSPIILVLAGNKTIVNKRFFFRKVSKELKKLKIFPEFRRPQKCEYFMLSTVDLF